MDRFSNSSAVDRVSAAHARVLSAWKRLMGRRIPLGGLEIDADGALGDLRAACEDIASAIRVIEASAPQQQPARAPVNKASAA